MEIEHTDTQNNRSKVMEDKRYLSWEEYNTLAIKLANRIKILQKAKGIKIQQIWGIPRGGEVLGIILSHQLGISYKPLLQTYEDTGIPESVLLCDDLVDTGETMRKYSPTLSAVLFRKPWSKFGPTFFIEETDKWIVFPYEAEYTKHDRLENDVIEQATSQLLHGLNVDLSDPNFYDTPARVSRMWHEICSSCFIDLDAEIRKVLSVTFPSENDQMVIVRDIELYSVCPHHLLPVRLNVSIGYIPDKKVLGLSKLARLAKLILSQPILQEDATNQIAEELQKCLNPLGVGVLLKGYHLCMASRGVKQMEHETITSAVKGVFKDELATRAEFLELL